jgi:hypothetical protein
MSAGIAEPENVDMLFEKPGRAGHPDAGRDEIKPTRTTSSTATLSKQCSSLGKRQ